MQCKQAWQRKALPGGTATLTPEGARAILAELTQILEDGASGRLGDDQIYRAAKVFRQLIGGRIFVHVEQRPGRKRTSVRAVLHPQILLAVQQEPGNATANGDEQVAEVEVWLRPPPRLDLIAERTHELMDDQGLSYREAAAALQREGYAVYSGNVWYSDRRYYAIHGLPVA
jgi:hypothetical protein